MADELQKAIHEILERVVRIETKIESYNGLREKLDKAYGMSYNNRDDITEIKDNQRWLWRTVIGGFIAAVITFIFEWGGKG